MRSAEEELKLLCDRILSAQNPRQRAELKAEATRIAVKHELQVDECASQLCSRPIRAGRQAIRFDGDLYCDQRCWADELRRKRGDSIVGVDPESYPSCGASKDQEAGSTA